MAKSTRPKRVAVVTGGTGALGGTVVSALLGDEWTVHVPWRTSGAAEALIGVVGTAHPRLHLHEADVSVEGDVDRLFRGVDEASGRLDALVNVAGGFAMGPIGELPVGQWETMIAANATSAFLCCRAAAPRMEAAGGGRIVSLAAAAALDAKPGMVAYVAAKAAVLAMTRALATELAPGRITVNAIAPTTIDTAANRTTTPAADRSGWVSPDQIAATILWLLGDAAAGVTGTIVRMGR